MARLSLKLNGSEITTEFAEGTHALDFLKNCGDRNAIKSPCSPLGSCGNCAIMVNGHPTLACLSRPQDLSHKSVETLGDSSEACFIHYNGQHLGRRYLMEKQEFCIGRDERSDLVLASTCVSREHARIIRSAGREYTIVDTGSTNKTFVNFKEVKGKTVLRNGDIIRLGTMLLKFYENNNIESAIHDRMYRLATFDELTQIYNRKFLMESLQLEIEKARSQDSKLTTVFMDLDFFKKVNDDYGHLGGDIVLAETAAIIKDTIRDFDVLGRYGGEEFVLLLPGTDGDQAISVADRIRRAIDAHKYQIKVGEKNGKEEFSRTIIHNQTVSIGVSWLSPETPDLKSMLDAADKSLYRSKDTGRNKTTGPKSSEPLMKMLQAVIK